MEWAPGNANANDASSYYNGASAGYMACASTPVPLFGVVVPGQPMLTDCQPVEPLGSGKWTLPLGPAFASPFVVVLHPCGASEPLPPGMGIGVYLARQDQLDCFQYIGALTRETPSSLFQLPSALCNLDVPVNIVLGLSLEREVDIQNLGMTKQQPSQQVEAATKVAIAERLLGELYNYVCSYARTVPGSIVRSIFTGGSGDASGGDEELLVMPIGFVDTWRDRLFSRIHKDIGFWQ